MINVVVADDNEIFCELVKRAIEDSGDMQLVGIARNGFEAVSVISEIQPDVVLLDNVMPLLDGLGVLEELNRAELDKRPKIITISSFSSDDFVKAACRLGANYCINRDVNISQILDRIRMLIDPDSFNHRTEVYHNTIKKKRVDYASFVSKTLHSLGIPANLKGFEYIRQSVLIVLDDHTAVNAITKLIYPRLATMFNTDSCNVERAIRHAIKISRERCDRAVYNKMFSPIINKNKEKPTNSEFIATITQNVLDLNI